MGVMILSSLAGIGASLMGYFLVALFRETRRVKAGMRARLSQGFGGGKNQNQNSTLFELATLPLGGSHNVIVMKPGIQTASDTNRRLAGGGRL